MKEFRFDGRTAIVTGAGGKPSLGRAHALLLASRGAKVVVNDIGHVPESQGYEDAASAQAVVDEIHALGGTAVADTHSVATRDGAEGLIRTAIDAFGSVDILVNNAGVSSVAWFDEMDPRDYDRHVEINLMGPVWTCLAAWPHMKAARYGRIVNIGSDAMAGLLRHVGYGATKGGLFSLTRGIAHEGAPHGILANCVHPVALTRMIEALERDTSSLLAFMRAQMPAELVSPAVAFLAHEDCPVTGETISVGGGKVRRVYLSQSEGIDDPDLSVESLAANWDSVMDTGGASILPHGFTASDEANAKPYRRERLTT